MKPNMIDGEHNQLAEDMSITNKDTRQEKEEDSLMKELKDLLDDPQTGLKESSDTNKTRSNILALFEQALKELKE
jgi:hypothetical protein